MGYTLLKLKLFIFFDLALDFKYPDFVILFVLPALDFLNSKDYFAFLKQYVTFISISLIFFSFSNLSFSNYNNIFETKTSLTL